MTSEEKAYIAGIIDGEGTVTLSRAHVDELPAPKVSVANNSLELLKWIRGKVGSGVIIKRSKREPQHKDQYVLDISNDWALDLLSDIKEYLIVKKPHAEILVSRYKTFTPRNGRYTKELLIGKIQIVNEIRALNQH